MLLGLSFRSAFVFSIKPLIFFGFLMASFHLAEANLILSNEKPLFGLFLTVKGCAGNALFFKVNFAIKLLCLHNMKT